MLKIKEIKAQSIIVKTNLPEGDFVINPYVGCMHGCKYCYARFMKRFTGHKEPWGSFVDIKINAPDLIPEKSDQYKNKTITIGSVCDPYQPVEKKYQLTKKILKKIIPLQPGLMDIMTKSSLVTRDIGLFKQFNNCLVAISFSGLDDKLRKKLEPLASSIEQKIKALKKLYQAGIKTVLFVSPIFPKITNWKAIIAKTKNFVNEYWFENLNLYPSIKKQIYQFLKENKPNFVLEYKKIYSQKNNYWKIEEKKIKAFCQKNKISFKIYFHH